MFYASQTGEAKPSVERTSMLMTWYKKASYGPELGYLNRYLKGGFDPYDYQDQVPDFLDDIGVEYDKNLEYYEVAEEWLPTASEEQLKEFRHWCENRKRYSGDEYDAPPYEAMGHTKLTSPGWLVHFTDDPYAIAMRGFEFGHEDMRGLALTTWKRERKRGPGYNFAFPLGSRDARIAEHDQKYGKHAVVFWGAGVQVTHYGDEEEQVIVWGPSVRKDLIFPMMRQDGLWVVMDWRNDRVLMRNEDFERMAHWVADNHAMLAGIREKSEQASRDYEARKKKSVYYQTQPA